MGLLELGIKFIAEDEKAVLDQQNRLKAFVKQLNLKNIQSSSSKKVL